MPKQWSVNVGRIEPSIKDIVLWKEKECDAQFRGLRKKESDNRQESGVYL